MGSDVPDKIILFFAMRNKPCQWIQAIFFDSVAADFIAGLIRGTMDDRVGCYCYRNPQGVALPAVAAGQSRQR